MFKEKVHAWMHAQTDNGPCHKLAGLWPVEQKKKRDLSRTDSIYRSATRQIKLTLYQTIKNSIDPIMTGSLINYCGKRIKCLYLAFSPVSQCFLTHQRKKSFQLHFIHLQMLSILSNPNFVDR